MVSTTSTAAGTVVDARMSLALWLRTGRAQKGMSLDDVARVTKIQPRILEKLEAGKLDGLPAEVFVRGFVRAFARCIGLDEDEALRRYRSAATAAGGDAATGALVQTGPSATVTPVGPAARALVESMAELAPVTARTAAPATPVVLVSQAPLAAGSAQDLPRVDEVVAAKDDVVVATVTEASTSAPSPSKKKARGKKRANKRTRQSLATGTPSSPMPVVAQSVVDEALGGAPAVAVDAADAAPVETAVEAAADVVVEAAVDVVVAPVVEAAPAADVVEAVAAESVEMPVVEVAAEPAATWQPRMPTVVAPTVPWRRPSHAVAPVTIARVVPSLVIDDADPDNAERELEERAAAKEPRAKARSFLPPILLDPDRSARQGGLTLAVIILLIAATLTLSYLMRRPGSSGDGVTQATPAASTDVFA